MRPWQFIIRLIKFSPGLFTLNLLAWTVFHTIPLATGLISRELFDTLTGNARLGFDLWTLLALIAAVPLVRKAASFGAMMFYTVFMYTMETLLRRNMLGSVLGAPGADAMSEGSGEAVSRFRDDTHEVLMYIEECIDFAGRLLYISVAFVVLFRLQPSMTLVLFLPLPALIFLINMARRRIHEYRRASREAAGKVSDFVGEMFRTTLAIKAAGSEAPIIERFRAINEVRRKAALKDQFFNELLRSVGWNIVHLGTGVVLLFAATRMRSGEFTVGDFALFVAYVTQATYPIFSIARLIAQHKRARVSFDRMVELTPGSPPETLVAHGPVHLRGALPSVPVAATADGDALSHLEVDGLTYHYAGTTHGVEDITFALKRGSFTVITGRIGSGKTTLVRAILGLLPKDSGEVRWNGVAVDDPGEFFTPPRSAYTPQVPRLFSESLRDNILMGIPEDPEQVDSAIRLSVMEDDLLEIEDGLNTVVGPRGVKLSGGQIQRSSAARMFARDVDLLVFDDLSSALDVETESVLWERVFGERAATYLVVSHRPSVLQRADHIIVMNGGRIEAQGTFAELMSMSEEARYLLTGSEEADDSREKDAT
ncbi:ABC transporter ATP-binding protein [Candidatus Poribacteria bacterium]|jgi:ATP-binding cassette, subfamily B, bacterial|nr:ABC transporter ATP-binding protein [Candidatus Poribacteria bacterium]MBT5532910.1 ABC transporter ATP-binding protein [Candidatus Poribacteria bacterium]MBT5713016.1 ABC transporter ATP-binding protein [Candidatus Poribacteria bacterium]MBT7804233.1 ABC transporter ATP-binding protein [Candidatus Poribacteria bacterium]